jgi:outer membrane protein TolC
MLQTATTERQLMEENLIQLNGGNPIMLTDSTFQTQILPDDFKLWYLAESAKNPDLQWIEQSATLNQKELQLSKAMLLPKFSTGYMSEKIGNEKHHGISLGISIPLWEGKNTVKAEKAKADALEQLKTDANLKFLSHLKSIYIKAVQLQKNAHTLSSTLQQINHSSLLTKAFEAGELSLIEYLNELTIYYDIIDKLLATEREAALARAQLFQLSR